ncbi:MAG: nucleotidyltransferase family protein [Egibacteraceae bacterium]
MARLIAATGHDLDVAVKNSSASLDGLTGPQGQRLQRRHDEVLRILARHGVLRARLFGSTVRGDDGEDSDVDLLVDTPSSMGLLGLARLQRDRETALGSNVDLVPANGLKLALEAHIETELVTL